MFSDNTKDESNYSVNSDFVDINGINRFFYFILVFLDCIARIMYSRAGGSIDFRADVKDLKYVNTKKSLIFNIFGVLFLILLPFLVIAVFIISYDIFYYKN